MLRAYDTILESEVSAALVAPSDGMKPYRYECACCGEEVYLAAAHSTTVVPHFKHRSGNNDVECEKYLGQHGTINTGPRSRKSKSERVEFYFDKNTKMFYINLRFSDNEINAYEQQKANFELSISLQEEAFLFSPINNGKFTPDIPTPFPIKKFSYNYFSSNTLNEIKHKYQVFSKNNDPTFLKSLGNGDFLKAKLVDSRVLYTNVLYFAAFQNQYLPPTDVSFPDEIMINDTFRFETMGRKWLGKVLTIKSKTAKINEFLLSWGYQLEASETLTLLWPPAAIIDGVSAIKSDNAFFYSSFELQAHGNINVRSEDIVKITGGISKVSIKPKTKVYRKNAEMIIDKDEKLPPAFDEIPFSKDLANRYTVPDNRAYFMFDRSGVKPLGKGQSVSLTRQSEVRRYDFGYLTGLIVPRPHIKKLTGDLLLKDILAHYKRTEHFDRSFFNSCKLSEIASLYLDECEASGWINIMVKRFIADGSL